MSDGKSEALRKLVEIIANDQDEGVPEYQDVIGCAECAKPMTDTERHYYESRCGECEALWFERVEGWRLGDSEDTELDEIYGTSDEQFSVH